jgi:hypothetical protein
MSDDLERELRATLDDRAGQAPQPHAARGAVSRARRRRGLTVAAGTLGAAAVVIAVVLVAGAMRSPSEGPPAATRSVTTTLNGITITYPEGWQVLDPDAAGLNGSPPSSGLPRLVLALTPIDTGEMLACPGMVEGPRPTSLMTIQEEPLAQDGDPAAGPWLAALEPLSLGPTGSGGTVDSGCYPGWEFLRAGWTAAGRTFEARVGFAPSITQEEQEAVEEAYASMTFAAVAPVPTPLPELPAPAQLEHGGTAWGVYLAVSEDPNDPALDDAVARAAALGYEAGVGEIACDQPAADLLGVQQDAYAVALYFAKEADAETVASAVDAPAPVGIAEVTTFCLD